MSSIEMNTPAPDFSLEDFQGKQIKLSDFQGQKNVVLVLNRGFV
ncbi:MAG: redoxin domain-containing protein [Anaerolineaceae bacterium]|nr:redoxin domain-containing protein [Anaerolineaceae bacterium]